MSNRPRFHWINLFWLGLSLSVFALDQGSKYLIREAFHPWVPFPLFSWLNIQLTFNQGTAFGLGNNQGFEGQRLLLVGIAFLITIYLLYLLLTALSKQRLYLFSLSLILGGALSNVWDRLSFGYVTDFIDFHLGSWHFATFNIADAAISVGAVLWIIYSLFNRE